MSDFQESALELAHLLSQSRRVVAFTGAGISTSAGLPDFRGPDGIYQRAGLENPEEIFDIETFRRDPSIFYKFHREFLRILKDVEPTFTHRFLAQEERRGRLQGVVTQNIDALHQRGGSRRVLEVHGSVWGSHCTRCRTTYDYQISVVKTLREEIPRCESCRGVLKPDVVFFGEAVNHMEESERLAEEADLMLVLGTALAVRPAAMLPALCPGKIVVVNKGELFSHDLPRSRVHLFVDGELDPFFQAVASHLEPSPEH